MVSMDYGLPDFNKFGCGLNNYCTELTSKTQNLQYQHVIMNDLYHNNYYHYCGYVLKWQS
jgi:hypothetical protein